MPKDHGNASIPVDALGVLQDDASLPICVTCGTQYPSARDRCVICEDPRQFVPATGQAWTSLSDLLSSRKHSFQRDEEDERISFIHTEPAFGINQTPILIETAEGSYVWDCAAFISPHLLGHLSELKTPLKAIAISHPHFFATSLTWSRALKVPLYLCEADKEWYQRLDDIGPSDDVRWWSDEVELGKGVKVIQCGGHFPGSSILHWDRLGEPAPPADALPTKPTPVSGIILTADTLMVMASQSHFTFIWSAPNMIPLRPPQVLSILERLKSVPFSQASSTWPGRFIRQDAKRILSESVTKHLGACGWRLDGDQLVPRDAPLPRPAQPPPPSAPSHNVRIRPSQLPAAVSMGDQGRGDEGSRPETPPTGVSRGGQQSNAVYNDDDDDDGSEGDNPWRDS